VSELALDSLAIDSLARRHFLRKGTYAHVVRPGTIDVVASAVVAARARDLRTVGILGVVVCRENITC
jgi:hypothetical protein